jgi:hypothetical protein
MKIKQIRKFIALFEYLPLAGEISSAEIDLGQDSNSKIISALLNTGVERKSGSAVINLPVGMESSQAVYLSFASEKRGLYSEDVYFAI